MFPWFGLPGSLVSGVAGLGAMLQQRQTVEFVTLPNPEPPRGILTLILESFALAGTLLLGTVLVGLGFGLFRIWLIRRYPDNRFNGSGRDTPRLDLS